MIARKKIRKEVRYELQLGQVVSFEVVQENEIDLYRSGSVNSKSFVSKDFLLIKWKFELNNAL